MQQVVDHPFITKNTESYTKGYDDWVSNRITELEELERKHAAELAKVSEEHKA